MVDLNALAARVAALNDRWWRNPATGEPIERNDGEMLMLVVTELAEALEGDRKGLMDDKLPHRPMPEVELADAYIRVLDIAGHRFPGQLEVLRAWEFTRNFGENLLGLTTLVVLAHQGKAARGYSHLLASIEALAEACGFDLFGAMEEKLAYNATRADHTNEARLAAGGKKY
ncbi:MAG: hypothetical protein AB7K63_17355 [Vicinamibacterales bacterium]